MQMSRVEDIHVTCKTALIHLFGRASAPKPRNIFTLGAQVHRNIFNLLYVWARKRTETKLHTGWARKRTDDESTSLGTRTHRKEPRQTM